MDSTSSLLIPYVRVTSDGMTTYLSYRSTEEEIKAADAAIAKEYDSIFGKPERSKLTMNPFLDKVVKLEYVGSRVTCNPPPLDTDEDVLILTDDIESLIGDCFETGFKRDGSIKSTYPSGFVSLRHGRINLIVTDEGEFFDKFMLATFVCKSLNLLSKAERVIVFQAILYGNKYPPGSH